MTTITAAISADAATSDAECRRDLAGHLADFRAALLDEAALIAAADRSRFDSEVATLTATRDIVIGQRETAQRERDEARGLLGALTADLNATRERLTTAEAHRDSLQAEVDKLRARPVLTVERLEDATANARSDRNARGATEGGFFPALSAAGIMAKLGTVTLPAQDRADDVIAAYVDEFAATAEREGMSPPDRWADVPDKRRAWCAGVMSRALASLGAPATTPSKLAEDDGLPWGVARAMDVPTEVRERGWQWHPIDSDTAFAPPFATIRACRHCGCLVAGGPTACVRCANDSAPPSKPADVFAGVSIEELDKIQMTAEVEYAIKVGSYSDSTPACRAAGLSAVLDALRVALVAPVDPEEVARASQDAACEVTAGEVVSWLNWQALSDDLRASRVATMRATLAAKGIPVTPEAGK